MTKAALLLQLEMSSSVAMIFLTRATGGWGVSIVFGGMLVEEEGLKGLRGSETAPVISLGGVIGVLLYGIVVDFKDGYM